MWAEHLFLWESRVFIISHNYHDKRAREREREREMEVAIIITLNIWWITMQFYISLTHDLALFHGHWGIKVRNKRWNLHMTDHYRHSFTINTSIIYRKQVNHHDNNQSKQKVRCRDTHILGILNARLAPRRKRYSQELYPIAFPLWFI